MRYINWWKGIAQIGRRKRHKEERPRSRIYQRKLRKDAIELIDILDRTEDAEIQLEHEELPKWKRLYWSDFPALWHLNVYNKPTTESGLHMEKDLDDLIRTDLRPGDLAHRLDVGWTTGTTFDSSESSIALQRIRWLGMSEARGKIIRPFPTMLAYYSAFWDTEKLIWMGSKSYWGHVRGSWMPIEKPTMRMSSGGTRYKEAQYQQGFSQQEAFALQMGLGIQLVLENNWVAYFGNGNGLRVGVPVDAAAIPTLFKARDKGPTERRKALRTWVKQHQRVLTMPEDNAANAQLYTDVRTHLRGANSFLWHGLDAQIHPAHIEEDANEEIAKHKRAATPVKHPGGRLRAGRTHGTS